jgi:hypothetical protein
MTHLRRCVLGSAHIAGILGSVSSTRRAVPVFPWSSPFPPGTPPCVDAAHAFVRALLRYYKPVRLPAVVHRGRAPSGFSARTAPTGRGQRRDLPGSVQDVSMRAWGLRPRGVRTLLAMAKCPMLPSTSGNGVGTPNAKLSRLNTQPASSPVNACQTASRPPSHDLGAVWFATPSLLETFTPYTLPAYPGASPCFSRPPTTSTLHRRAFSPVPQARFQTATNRVSPRFSLCVLCAAV